MSLAQGALRGRLLSSVEALSKVVDNADVKAACEKYLETKDSSTLKCSSFQRISSCIRSM
jgi:pyruvate-ferredoxin/flavodoxin oxidoreductase